MLLIQELHLHNIESEARKIIKLEIEDKCQFCPEFKAEINTEEVFANFEEAEKNFLITCKNRGICKNIQRYLEKTKEPYDEQ